MAAPWVVLDSGSDMLAMSSEVSEVSDTTASLISPPKSIRGHESVESVEDSVETQTPGTVHDSEVSTTEETPVETTYLPIASVTEENLNDEITETTEGPRAEEKETESTTATATVGSMVESGLKQEDLDIHVVPELITMSESEIHPNSIEENDSFEPIIVISKKKFSGFTKKKFYGF